MNMRKLMDAVASQFEEPAVSNENDPWLAKEGKPQYGMLATYMPTYYRDIHDDRMKRWGHTPVTVTDLGTLTEYIWPDLSSMLRSKMAGAKTLSSSSI